MIKYILWDIDGTLLNFKVAEAISIRKAFEKFSLGLCSDEMLFDYSNINVEYWKRMELGQISKSELLHGRFKEFFSKYNIDTSIISEFNSFYQESLGHVTAFNPSGLEVVTALNDNYKQYAVTNGTAIAQKGKLKNSGLNQIFSDIFISDEIGVEKPNLGFFDVVFSRVGSFNPSEYFIIGDSLTSDIQGGINAGIKTCWFNPNNKENILGLDMDFVIKDLVEVLDILAYLNKSDII